MDRQLIAFLLLRPSSWFACVQALMAKILSKPTVRVWRQGFKIITGTGNGEGLFCALAGTDYEHEMAWFLDQMKPGNTFIDVGANIGIYCLHASRKLGPGGKVHAFEPTSETYDILTKNIGENRLSNVECHKLALAEHSGILYLVAEGRPASNSMAVTKEEAKSDVSIPASTLDEFCVLHRVPTIHFIKVDIEGGELAFFKGGKETLLKHKPLILFESMHTGPTYPEREWLRQLGYKLFFLDQDTLVEADPDCARGGNVIAKYQ